MKLTRDIQMPGVCLKFGPKSLRISGEVVDLSRSNWCTTDLVEHLGEVPIQVSFSGHEGCKAKIELDQYKSYNMFKRTYDV